MSFPTVYMAIHHYQQHNRINLVACQRTILDINYVVFLQFQRYFTPQAELEELLYI